MNTSGRVWDYIVLEYKKRKSEHYLDGETFIVRERRFKSGTPTMHRKFYKEKS